MKQSDSIIRKNMKEMGAHFFEFSSLNEYVSDPSSYKQYIDQWKTMEKKGFLITDDIGCILPYSYYCKSNEKGDQLKGHERSVHFFFGYSINKSPMINQHGWPCDENISHLCHRVDCINPLHLVIEEKWKNMKRNYCGIDGICDCGIIPQCLKTYHNYETFKESISFLKNKDNIHHILSSLQEKYPFKILPKTFYDVDDQKKDHKNKRIRAQKKHDKESERKKLKKDTSYCGFVNKKI